MPSTIGSSKFAPVPIAPRQPIIKAVIRTVDPFRAGVPLSGTAVQLMKFFDEAKAPIYDLVGIPPDQAFFAHTYAFSEALTGPVIHYGYLYVGDAYIGEVHYLLERWLGVPGVWGGWRPLGKPDLQVVNQRRNQSAISSRLKHDPMPMAFEPPRPYGSNPRLTLRFPDTASPYTIHAL